MTDSVSELKRLLEEQEDALGTDSPKVANTLTALGDLLCMHNRFFDAEPLYWRVLEIRHKSGGQRNLEVAAALQDLSLLYEKQESWPDAERLLRWCCDIKRELLGPQDPEYIASLSRLGRVLDMQGKHEDVSLEATSTPSEGNTNSVPGVDRYPWNDHCATARDLLKKGHIEEAARYVACLTDTAACFAADSVHHARILNLQARTLFRLNNHVAARTACEKALAIFERAFGTNHLETMECLVNMANIHVAKHEFGEAKFLYQWAHAIAITLEGEGSDKARKLEQKMASLPGAKAPADESLLDGSFLLDVQSEVLFSTGEYMKPDLSKLAQIQASESTTAAKEQQHPGDKGGDRRDANRYEPSSLSGAVPASGEAVTGSQLSPRSRGSADDINANPDEVSVTDDSSERETRGERSDESISASPEQAAQDSARADDFFKQLQALGENDLKKLDQPDEPREEQIPAAPSTQPQKSTVRPSPSFDGTRVDDLDVTSHGEGSPRSTEAQFKPDAPAAPPATPPRTVSQFGRAFGLEQPQAEPLEPPKPSGPHYIEEFDSNVASFLWEKYVSAGHRALSQRNYVEAERMYSVAAEKANGFNDERLWKTLCHLGLAHQHQKKYVRAESVFKQAQTLCEKRLGPEHVDNTEYWKHLGGLYQEQRNLMLAEQCYKKMFHLMTKANRPASELREIKMKLAEFHEQLPSH